jgi:hypothetical protein
MSFHEHHFRNLGRARDHLTETIVSLRSAVDQMTGDDWIDATALLHDISLDIAPRLGRLRTAASERFDEHTRLVEFERCAPASCRSRMSAACARRRMSVRRRP